MLFLAYLKPQVEPALFIITAAVPSPDLGDFRLVANAKLRASAVDVATNAVGIASYESLDAFAGNRIRRLGSATIWGGIRLKNDAFFSVF
jgi:hypothetical protein